jgi:amidase
LLDKALEKMKELGAEIVEVEYMEAIEKLGDYELKILQYEFKDGVNKYLSTANARVKTLTEVIAFNKANEDKAMPFFKQEQLETCEKTEGLDAAAYKEALAKGRDESRKILTNAMEQNKLDAIAGITMGPACAIDMLYGDRYSNDFLTQPAAMAGYPHISVPMGQMFALPVGLSLFGMPYTELKLIQMAFAFEQSTGHRQSPAFLSTLPES